MRPTLVLASIVVAVTLHAAAGWLWDPASHQRSVGGDADVRVRAPASREPHTSRVDAGHPLEAASPRYPGMAPGRGSPYQLGPTGAPALREVPLGAGPGLGAEALAFDGTSLWVTSQFANTLTRVRASDGETLGTVVVGSRPIAVLADPSGIWVANLGDNTVTKLRPSDGAVLGTFTVGDGPGGFVSG